MITETSMLYLYVETPLHVGVGSGLSSIDLPIQRERTTQYPMIQGSSIKGELRATASSEADRREQNKTSYWTREDVNVVFGPESNGSDHASALIAGDARILLFPVRSLSGVFAYTTSVDVLNRFYRDSHRSGIEIPWKAPNSEQEHVALVSEVNRITADDTIVLEEFSFDVETRKDMSEIATWLAANAFPQSDEYAYWRQKIQDSLVILPENDFRDFVVNSTEIITRIRINRDTKTVEGGALWTEEHLPTDTLLYVPIYATNARKRGSTLLAADVLRKAKTLEESQQGYIQLGGDETIGRGMVRMHWR